MESFDGLKSNAVAIPKWIRWGRTYVTQSHGTYRINVSIFSNSFGASADWWRYDQATAGEAPNEVLLTNQIGYNITIYNLSM